MTTLLEQIDELEFPTEFINQNWRIKVNGNGLNTLVGVSGLINLVGFELANKLLIRAAENPMDKTECRLRRGIKITFYTK